MIPKREWLEGVFCWGVLAGWLSFWLLSMARVQFYRWLDRNDRKLKESLMKIVTDDCKAIGWTFEEVTKPCGCKDTKLVAIPDSSGEPYVFVARAKDEAK